MNRYHFIEEKTLSIPLTSEPHSGEIWVGKKNKVSLQIRNKVRGEGKRAIWNAAFQAGIEMRLTEISTDTLLMDYKKQ